MRVIYIYIYTQYDQYNIFHTGHELQELGEVHQEEHRSVEERKRKEDAPPVIKKTVRVILDIYESRGRLDLTSQV